MPNNFETARLKYKPEIIKYLLVAEAPPNESSNRFFYYEKVSTGDSLFLETMKVLYPEDTTVPSEVRGRKRELLERFRKEGFYLIDSTDSPMEDSKPSKKRERIQESLPSLRKKLRELAANGVKIILISAPVYHVCADVLKAEKFNVINNELIDFPGSGGQKKFRDKFATMLKAHRWVGSAE